MIPKYDGLNSINFGKEPPKTTGEMDKKGDDSIQSLGKNVEKSTEKKAPADLELKAKLDSFISS